MWRRGSTNPELRRHAGRAQVVEGEHIYGDAVDLAAWVQGFRGLALQARNHGFSGILGPGHPGHSDHTQAAHRSSRLWSASSCGI